VSWTNIAYVLPVTSMFSRRDCQRRQARIPGRGRPISNAQIVEGNLAIRAFISRELNNCSGEKKAAVKSRTAGRVFLFLALTLTRDSVAVCRSYPCFRLLRAF
jgi:hypothetical protein